MYDYIYLKQIIRQLNCPSQEVVGGVQERVYTLA